MIAPANYAAEEELQLLTISGDLIGKLDDIGPNLEAQQVIKRYYAELPDAVRSRLQSLQNELSAIQPNYLVASAAGDTAELNELMDDLVARWAKLRTTHSQYYTTEVVQVLDSVFAEIYEWLH